MILRIMLLSLLALIISCRESSSTLLGVQLRLVSFAGIRPTEVVLGGGSGIPSLAQATLRYQLSPEDQLQVTIQEFADPIQAYGFWCGSGQGPTRLPVIKTGMVEQSIWSGRWIFQFRYPPHRQPENAQMDSLVHSFPESGGSLPPIFLTLPLHQRQENGTTIQDGVFLGMEIPFTLLEQRYQSEIGSWSMARSLTTISENDMNNILGTLGAVGFHSIGRGEGTSRWTDGKVQLILGRSSGVFLAVWSTIDSETLLLKWQQGALAL